MATEVSHSVAELELSEQVETLETALNFNPALEFMEIEPPLAPDTEWLLLSDTLPILFFGVLLLLILLGLWKYGARFYQPLTLRWQLNRLIKQYELSVTASKSTNHRKGKTDRPGQSQGKSQSQLSRAQSSQIQGQTIVNDQAWSLYGWCQNLRTYLDRQPSMPPEFEPLWTQVTQVSFSKQAVSRETYAAVLQEADRVLSGCCQPFQLTFQPTFKLTFKPIKSLRKSFATARKRFIKGGK